MTQITDQPLTQTQLDAYVAHVQELQNAYFKRMGFTYADPPKVTYDLGQRYVRIVKNDVSQKSVHTFLDRTNGDILKGAWKSPVKNGVRGNINKPGWESCITEHGAAYLR